MNERWLIDFDSTIFNMGYGQLRSLYNQFGIHVDSEEITTWTYWNDGHQPAWIAEYIWGESVFKNRDWTLATPAYDGVIRTLHEMVDAGEELVIITDRATDMEDWIRDWLVAQAAPALPVIATNHTRKKADLCQELSITVGVEDGHHHIAPLTEAGLDMFLVTRPWNAQLDEGRAVRVGGVETAWAYRKLQRIMDDWRASDDFVPSFAAMVA